MPKAADNPATSTGDASRVAISKHVVSTSINGPGGTRLVQAPAGCQPQIGGIGHAEHEIGQRFAGGAPEHDIAGDFLVGLRPRSE